MPRPDAAATAARAAAWAAWLGGWLLLGALGHRSGAPGAGSVLPLVLWLATTALLGEALRHLAAGRCLPNRAVAAAGLAGGAAAAWALAATAGLTSGVAAEVAAHMAPAGLLALAAVGWAVLTVASSQAVRAGRRGRRTPAAHVLAAALAGAALATAAAHGLTAGGGPLGPVLAATLPLAVALVAAGALCLAPGEGSTVCARGLLDHLWPPRAGTAAGGVPAPLAALAAAAMLPMMAVWPALADACAAAGWPAAWVAPLHVAAMLLPAVAAAALPRGLAAAACAALLLGGGVAALTLPGVAALATACALQAAAWGVAWGATLKAMPDAHAHADATRCPQLTAAVSPGLPAAAFSQGRAARWLGPLAVPATVAATGLAWAQAGPAALMVLHAALAAGALAWCVVRAGRGACRPTMLRHGLAAPDHPAGSPSTRRM